MCWPRSAIWPLSLGVLLIGRYALSWVVAVAAAVRLATVTANITTGAAYSEDDVEESVVADIGLDRREQLAETSGARSRQRSRIGSQPIADGLRRSSPSCSQFT